MSLFSLTYLRLMRDGPVIDFVVLDGESFEPHSSCKSFEGVSESFWFGRHEWIATG